MIAQFLNYLLVRVFLMSIAMWARVCVCSWLVVCLELKQTDRRTDDHFILVLDCTVCAWVL